MLSPRGQHGSYKNAKALREMYKSEDFIFVSMEQNKMRYENGLYTIVLPASNHLPLQYHGATLLHLHFELRAHPLGSHFHVPQPMPGPARRFTETTTIILDFHFESVAGIL